MADLARRAPAAVARRSRREERGPLVEYLVFSLVGEPYGAPVDRIREILKPPPLTPVPRAPHAVIGIVSVRGQLVTVLDLARRLRVGDASPGRRTRILLTESPSGETMGLLVDEVRQVHRLSESEIELAASALGNEAAPFIAGIARPVVAGDASGAKRADEVIVLLDLAAVLTS